MAEKKTTQIKNIEMKPLASTPGPSNTNHRYFPIGYK